MASLITIEAIGEAYAQKLRQAGIRSTEALLESGSTPKGRRDTADKTGISTTLILEWVNLADLFRIKGIGEEYADLLEEAGMDTVPELAHRNAENLHQKLVEVNEEKGLVRRVPTSAQVKEWVQQAKQLPRVVTY
jgi:predicted flap endonuclease-1-like 5' DNA nuclease